MTAMFSASRPNTEIFFLLPSLWQHLSLMLTYCLTVIKHLSQIRNFRVRYYSTYPGYLVTNRLTRVCRLHFEAILHGLRQHFVYNQACLVKSSFPENMSCLRNGHMLRTEEYDVSALDHIIFQIVPQATQRACLPYDTPLLLMRHCCYQVTSV